MNWTPYYAICVLLWLIACSLGIWYFETRRTGGPLLRRRSWSRRICLIAAMIAVPVLYYLSYPLYLRLAAADSRNAVTIDCAIEIQIAVVTDLKPGHKMTDGDWHVAAACVLPVRSTGGPGHVVSNTDGTIIELQWSDVRLIHDGKWIAFDDFEYVIRNRIDCRSGTSYSNLGSRQLNSPRTFPTDSEWYWIAGKVGLAPASREPFDRWLVIRGRYLPKAPPAQPLHLEEMAGLEP
jgi:hypothetical protein